MSTPPIAKGSPGVCVNCVDGNGAVKVDEVDPSEDDLNHLECLMLDYQPR